MSATARLKAVLRMDNSQYKAAARESTGATKTFQDKVSSVGSSVAVAFSVAAVIGFTRAVTKAAAQMETLRVQFESMGLSIEVAKQHMADLRDFATSTPFQLENIAAASQQLFLLSEGILGGKDSLRLFGDAAAKAGQQDLGNFAFWVGRLFAAIKSGDPITEAANALLRLKGITVTTRDEMRKMSTAGAKGSEIWKVYTDSLKAAEGSMERLAKTTDGGISTMKDAWKELGAVIGEVFEPVTKGAIKLSTAIAKTPVKFHEFINPFSDSALLKNEGLAGGVDLPDTGQEKQLTEKEQRKLDAKKFKDQGKEDDSRAKERAARSQSARRVEAAQERAEQRRRDIGADFARRAKDERDKDLEARGQGVRTSSLAQVGGFVGPGRSGVGIADRQLNLAKEQLDRTKRLEKLAERRNIALDKLEQNTKPSGQP